MRNWIGKGALASSVALMALAATPALAAGTTAGADITNTVTVNFQVGGNAQTAVTASNTFKVDRLVAFTVTEVGTSNTLVSPNQLQAVTVFQVANQSNATIDVGLLATQLDGTTVKRGGTDNFDVTNIQLYLDVNGDGLLDNGDILITYIDELEADDDVQVLVVANIPIDQVNGDLAGIVLTGTAREGGAANAQGAVITATAGGNTDEVDTVLGGTNEDGIESDQDVYQVQSALLSVLKYSRVVWDPVNLTDNPKMIPGARVEYCIAVSNGEGAQTATNIVVSDPIPANTTYYADAGVSRNGTVSSQVCSGGTNDGTFDSNTVTAALNNLAAEQTLTVYFQVTVN